LVFNAECINFAYCLHKLVRIVKQEPKKIVARQKLYLLLIVLPVLIITLIVAFCVCSHFLQAENHIRYVGMNKVVSEKIAKTVKSMETNALNVFDEVEKHLDTPESVVSALHSKASLAPDVRGYFAAFEPHYFKEKGQWFEPYVHHSDSTEFEMTQVGSARHDYTKSDWYIHAKNFGESFWSEPYYYYDGTSISGHYTTFVKPVFDSAGNLACVCGADMTFEWLTKELQKIDEASKSDSLLNAYHLLRDFDFYSIILTNDGSCIVHPEGKNMPIKDENVLRDLTEKKSGIVEMDVHGIPSVVYYGPIEHIDWSLAIIVPKYSTLKAMFLLGVTFCGIALIAIILIWLVLYRYSLRE